MKVLVAVASKHGSTREIAQTIAGELRAAGLTVDVHRVDDVEEVAGYDAVVLGSAVYVGQWLSEAQRFAERHRSDLSRLPLWLFSSGPLGAEDSQPRDDPDRLVAPLGDVRAREHRVFAGKLDLAALGFGERLLARLVRAPKGDFRDWEEIRAWAREIAAELRRTGHCPEAT